MFCHPHDPQQCQVQNVSVKYGEVFMKSILIIDLA